MNRMLYIAPSGIGQTSVMREKCLEKLLEGWKIEFLDPYLANQRLPRLVRSASFRLKVGPMIRNIDCAIRKAVDGQCYDVIWVDKGTMISPKVIQELRGRTGVLVHYTPDPAFTFHRSRLFFQAIPEYDYLITTKKFELDDYRKAVSSPDKVILTTQGFDKNIHYPRHSFAEKRGVALGGHYEENRAEALDVMLKSGIEVKLCGSGWENFVAAHRSPLLHYYGPALWGDAYADFLSSAQFGYGAISEWIPERHTTRSFEIPACGTALLTTWNEELEELLGNTPVYFDSLQDMVEKIRYYQERPEELKAVTECGFRHVVEKGYDYESIMRRLLSATHIL